MTVHCHFCGDPVDIKLETVWRRVVGWERKASALTSRKGGSDIVLREQQKEFACNACISRLRRGVAPAQGSLV